jgi:hypothetical protein
MSAVLMLLVGAGGVATSVLAIGKLSRRVRLLVGESGAAEATCGFDCVLKSSVIVLPECFRFSEPELADIGGVKNSTSEDAELWTSKPRCRGDVDTRLIQPVSGALAVSDGVDKMIVNAGGDVICTFR